MSPHWENKPPPLFDSQFPTSGEPRDPYLVWAWLTGVLKVEDGVHSRKLPFLLETNKKKSRPFDIDTETEVDLEVDDGLKDALADLHADLSAWDDKSCYQTVWLCVCPMCLSVLIWLLNAKAFKRIQLCAARGMPMSSGQADELPAPAGENPLLRQTLGVIDDGCCLAHASFRKANNTSRFEWVWDQNPRVDRKSIWKKYHCSYGEELSNDEINQQLMQHPGFGEAAEREFYRKIDRSNWGASDRTHGARVLHLLAAERQLVPQPEVTSEDRVAGMQIIFVQLPEEAVADTSGGSLGFHVLSGARYIVDRTEQSANGFGWETTINVSLGSIAGPHDGTTITELALDELAKYTGRGKDDGNGKVRIVVAAGNTAGRALHAFRKAPSDPSKQFRIMVQPDNFRGSFVEFWLPLWSQQEEDTRYSFTVKTPDGTTCDPFTRGAIRVLKARNGSVVGAAIFVRAAAQSQKQTMMLLAIAPTARLDGEEDRTAPYGVWEVEVKFSPICSEKEPAPVHAWVERDDTIVGVQRPQRTHFVPDRPPGSKDDYVCDEVTLSTLANGKGTEHVGAYEIGAFPRSAEAYDVRELRVTPYSGRGPVLCRPPPQPPPLPSAWPGISKFGPGDFSRSLPGIGVPGFFTGTRSRLSGTSAAAARVARWIAEGATEEELNENVRPPHGHARGTVSPAGVIPIDEIDDLA